MILYNKGREKMNIPKKIHYCWFGENPKSQLMKKCITSWKKNTDYEIIEWNEKNFDVHCHPFASESYKLKKYAFLSDFVRLNVIYEYGGIYLDTDVEMKKNFDEFLNNDMFLGFMFDCTLGTAIFGAKQGNGTIKKLLALYDNDPYSVNLNNNDLFTRFFMKEFSSFQLNNKLQTLNDGANDIIVYPKEYFERPTYNRNMGYSVHYYNGSWYNKKVGNFRKFIKFITGEVLYGKMSHYKALVTSPFYKIYLEQRKQNNYKQE
nr:glycosyltransferase [Clostridium pasteurianum]